MVSKKKNDKMDERNQRIVFFILSVFVLIIRIVHVSELYGPFVFDDEMGYWTHAANLSGHRWVDTEGAWYSYGYSIVLIPLFWIFHDMVSMYRAAVVLNGMMGVLQFWLGIDILKKLNVTMSWGEKYIVSFVASVFSAYIFQSKIGYAETFLYLWTMFTFWGILCWIEKTDLKNTVLISLQIFFLYVIHNRSIVVFVAYGAILLLMSFWEKIDLRYVVCALLIMVFGYYFNLQIRYYLESVATSSVNGKFTANDISAGTSALKNSLFSIAGLWKLCMSFICKVWALFTETLLLGYLGFVYIIKNIYIKIKNKDRLAYFYIYVFLFFMGTLAVTAVMMNPTFDDVTELVRLDPVFYCRYSDAICGLLVIMGILEIKSFFSDKNKYKTVAVVLIGGTLYFVCSCVLLVQIDGIEEFFLNTPCVPGLYFSQEFDIFFVVSCVISIYALLLLFSFLFKKNSIYIVSIIAGIIFWGISENAYVECIVPNQRVNVELQELIECIDEFDAYYPIYMYSKHKVVDDYYFIRQRIRANIVDTTVSFKPIEKDEMLILVPDEAFDSIRRMYPNSYLVNYLGKIKLMAVGKAVISQFNQMGYTCVASGNVSTIMPGNYSIVVNEGGSEKTENGFSFELMMSSNDNIYLRNDKDLKLSYHVFDEDGNCVLYDGERTRFNDIIGNGTIVVDIDSEMFEKNGKYRIVFDIVEEGVAWYGDIGGSTTWAEVEVY